MHEITIGDVEWYNAYLTGHKYDEDHILGLLFDATGCGHYTGWVSYDRDLVRFDTLYGTAASGRYVDAAVRILDNSDVYVKNSITDVSMVQYSINTNGTTGNISSPNQQGSDVLLVLPGKENSNGERSNFRLKIDGDAHILHTQDSNYYVVSNPLTDGYLYRYDQASPGPGLPFPIAQSPVLLSGGVNRYKEADVFWSYVHPRELLTLTDSVTFSDSTKWMPYGVTKSSVYGVHGEYRGGTNISTRDIAGKDTTAIIEIGCVTDSQSYFKVYSAGMLKNYRSELVNGNDSLIVGNLVDNLAPGFYLSNDTMPLYIINDGKGTKTLDVNAGIKFNAHGIDSINKAIATATGGSDLHIQANRFVRFANGSPNFTLKKDNEIKILADYGYVHATDSITFADADSAHFTIWAQGPADATRGVFNEGTTYGGAIEIGKRFTAKYNDTKKGSGLVLVRSENDDVLVKEQFEFRNIAARDSSGELMVQAAQDIRLKDSVLLTQDGRRSMLFEAGKTAYFGNGFIAKLGRTMNNGDLTIKAGYPVFFPTADVASPLAWGAGNNYTNNGYTNRQDGQVLASGGDIWFDGNAEINLNPRLSDSVDVFIRAFNSIYLSGQFITNLQSVYTPASGTVDTILKYAETGNIESQTKGTDSDSVVYNINAADSTYLLFQAGNILGNPCGATLNYASDKWHGNILFGPNKVFAISHKGVGPTLISAARDIENQIGANFHFTYENSRLSAPGDNLLITAGRHIETHANYTIDYSTAGTNVTNNITMRAGHQADGICPVNLCKALETMSNVGYNYPAGLESQDNMFADGGSGNGSILLFDTLSYIYRGHGNILVTALNGNIESDPYLHGEAPILINHNDGTGTTRFEAIDIKLHDSIAYLAETTGDKRRNGQFYLFAYDSILTRNVQYVNKYDTGSVFISADKYKQTAIDCGLDCILGINAGHIVLGYGADAPTTPQNINDSIIFNFNKDGLNSSTAGANVHILAGFRGYDVNKYLGKNGSFSSSYLTGKDKGKAFGGNITMDYSEFWMAPGNGNLGGYTEIRTPNGNIWGKDSMVYHGFNGNLLVDAGLGSVDDPHAILWGTTGANYNLPTQVCPDRLNILNTAIRVNCDNDYSWRTGNIMLKGGTIDFADINTGNPGVGTAVYRTREGYIDTYDAFTVQNMTKGVLKYAGMDNLELGRGNNFGDVSERDFKYIPVENSGSIFFGADDNIMLNYGNSNYTYLNYGGASFALGTPGNYDLAGVNKSQNP
ncbi:MAG: hypothetical protein LBD53_00415, partial [Tannerella sp.]|nr:hypothetical protein [Tannerella sp.]